MVADATNSFIIRTSDRVAPPSPPFSPNSIFKFWQQIRSLSLGICKHRIGSSPSPFINPSVALCMNRFGINRVIIELKNQNARIDIQGTRMCIDVMRFAATPDTTRRALFVELPFQRLNHQSLLRTVPVGPTSLTPPPTSWARVGQSRNERYI